MAILVAPVLARSLGPTGRGELAAVLAPLTLADPVAAIGTQTTATYFVSKGEEPSRVVRLCLALLIPTALLAYTAIFCLAPTLAGSDSHLASVLRIAAIAVFFGALSAPIRGSVVAMGRYGYINLERWLAAGCRAVVIVVAALVGSLTVPLAVSASLVTGLLASLVLVGAFSVGGRHSRKRNRHSRGKSRASTMSTSDAPVSLKTVSRYSLSTWIWTIGTNVNARLDQVLLAGLVPPRDLGLYAVAVTLAELPASVLTISQRIVLAELSADAGRARLGTASRVTLESSIVLAAISALLGPFCVRLVFGTGYNSAAPLFLILLVGSVFWSLSQTLASALAAYNCALQASLTEIFGAIVTCVGILVFAPHYGIKAAAWTSVAAYAIVALLRIFYLKKLGHSSIGELVFPRRSDLHWLRAQVGKLRG